LQLKSKSRKQQKVMADIIITQLNKSYGPNPAVNDLNCEIKSQEFVVILGPSGCGKSTFLRMIAGLETITSGEIRIDNIVVNDLEPRERGCAMVFQNYALYPHMTVAENIGYALKVSGIKRDERLRRIADVAKIIGLEDFLERKPGQLSGGQRQRVAMGRAIIREPKLFLFDEPLSNLDAKLRVQMRIEIRKLHNRLKATSIFVTHDQIEAMTLADRMIVMNKGRIEQIGTPENIYREPASKFVAGFVGSPPMNLLGATVIDRTTLSVGDQHISILPHQLQTGSPVTLGVRPEHVVLDNSTKNNVFMVDFIEDMGAVRLLHGKLGEQDFVVQSLSGTAPQLGFSPVNIAPHKIHLFDAATGLRINI